LVAALWHTITFPLVFLSRGPLLLLIGLLLVGLSHAVAAHPNGTVFRLGGSFLIIGASMLLRWILTAVRVPDQVRNRIGYTLAGLGLVVFFLTPLDTFRAAGTPAFDAGAELFFMAGLIIVLGGVWAVMFNADVLLRGLLLVFGSRGSLAPVLKMAVSYPLQNRFRTGMTVAMFSLVIFLLMLISVLLDSTRTALNLSRDAGGFAIYGTTNATTPIRDLSHRIAADPTLKGRVEAGGGVAPLDMGVRQPGQQDQSFALVQGNVADAGYLTAQHWTLHARAAGYASDSAVWQDVARHPADAVIDGSLAQATGTNGRFGGFSVHGVRYQSHGFRPATIELRDARSGRVLTVRVIGVLDRAAQQANNQGIWLSAQTLAAAHDLPAIPTSYYFRVAPGANVHQTALALGSAFLSNGLDVKETQVEYDRNQAASDGLFNLLEGFMALGLVVGVAALGVIAFRSVVERRQQIGMMRAIGFKRSMVRTGFLIETSFVAVLGTVLGLLLGGLVGKQYVDSLASSNPAAHLTIPWGQVLLIVVIAYAASVLTTYLPAWQASRIYPAEALRYE
jgi:putative ABC transport system permease protein